jgi:hypothetical protein
MVIVAPMEQECAGLMSLMAEAFQFHGARFRHVAYAFAGIDAGDDALTYAVNAIRGLRRLDRPAPTKRARRQGPVVEASPSAPVAAAMITGKVPIAAQNSLNEIRPEEFLKACASWLSGRTDSPWCIFVQTSDRGRTGLPKTALKVPISAIGCSL